MSAESGLHLECKVVVPKQFMTQAFPSPNGQPESVRYKEAYEAFWWNCVAIMSKDMNSHCPIMASGTPAASSGAADGAMAAINGINDLVKNYGAARVQTYLEEVASPPSKVKAMLHGYFVNGPQAESQN